MSSQVGAGRGAAQTGVMRRQRGAQHASRPAAQVEPPPALPGLPGALLVLLGGSSHTHSL